MNVLLDCSSFASLRSEREIPVKVELTMRAVTTPDYASTDNG